MEELNALIFFCGHFGCDFWSYIKEERNQHEGDAHNMKRVGKFHCGLCEKTYKNKNSRDRHEQEDHQGLPRVLCPICFADLRTRRILQGHMFTIHGIMPELQEGSVATDETIASMDFELPQ